MSTNEPSFTVGIEEEYLLVDKTTRALASDPPAALLRACQESRPGEVSPEFLRCQIEIGTPVCKTIGEARTELTRLRKMIADNAAEFGLAPIAASTHPFGDWDAQLNTDKERYNELAKTMQVVARRLLICGMHVHVGIDDDVLRIDLLSQLTYFLPHLLALSTSSPFWRGRKTGLGSYRLSVFNELPRTGLPEAFASPAEYQRTIDILVKTGLIEDGTKIWWDLRPSARFPTLEMRISDVCTRVDDALAIAALFRCITRMLWRLRRDNQRWRQYPVFLIEQNRWLAQRDGVNGELVDFGLGASVPFAELLDELLELTREDAEYFGCLAAVEHTRAIAAEGTSAARQRRVYQNAVDAGASDQEALEKVVDHLIAETMEGCG